MRNEVELLHYNSVHRRSRVIAEHGFNISVARADSLSIEFLDRVRLKRLPKFSVGIAFARNIESTGRQRI